MEKIALVTDSGSSLTVKTAPLFGVYLLKMPVIIDNEVYYEDISLTFKDFVEKMKNHALPKTSQPSIGEAEELFEQLLKEYDRVIVLPISRAISSTYDSLVEVARKFNDAVFVADHRVVCGSQMYAIYKVQTMIRRGDSFQQIVSYLNSHPNPSFTYAIPYDISHLERTGRSNAGKTFVASLFKMFPILTLRGDKSFVPVGKCRNFRIAINETVEALVQDGANAQSYHFSVMQIENIEAAEYAREEIKRVFGDQAEVDICQISPVIASHLGLKSIMICANEKL